MKLISKIKKIELEITSNCNAACPGCARTQNHDKLSINSFSIADIKRLFPSVEHINNKQFKFCGVLGDPILNKHCLEMIEYLSTRGGFCQISTNGGYQNSMWWEKLGKLSYETGNVEVHFCVDGHKETNHIYRVNTVFDVIDRNMKAYSTGGNGNAIATWIFIVFDHNEYELEAAKTHALRLGFKFAVRTGMRNSYESWVSKVKKKDSVTNKVETQQHIITTTGSKEHSKKNEVDMLNNFIETYKKEKISNEKIEKVTNSIVCKFLHEGEIFISSNLKLWPCCFLWDSYFKNSESISEKLKEYGHEWNNLKIQSIDEVLDHPWYEEVLELSWNPYHDKHLSRCIRTCANNKAYHNEIREI